MLFSLTPGGTTSSAATSTEVPTANVVGGKAASLAKLYSIPQLSNHVPKSFALTVAFFQPWMDLLQNEIKAMAGGGGGGKSDMATKCADLQQKCQTLPLNQEQRGALSQLSREMATFSSTNGLAAVRSSAPEEDGSLQSFAGAFETKLGVTATNLEQAVRECFASRFDARVWSYIENSNSSTTTTNNKNGSIPHSSWKALSFAVVVMEMIDSQVAGVAFSANPLNSDRDELVVDSAFGLGESVVDGSVSADRYVYDKISQTMLTKSIGKKTQEKRLASNGGVETKSIDDNNRQNQSSLSDEQAHELAQLVCVIEEEYGVPVDVEWAYTYDSGDADTPTLKLLQARPITTLFYIDDNMMTKPGEKRILYYDYNIVADATTTSPFTHMDMNFYCWASSAMMGFPDRDIFTEDPNMPIFKASTRQYTNLSIFLRYMSTKKCAEAAEVLDPYLASLFASTDCDGDKYKMKKLPDGVGLGSAWKLFRQFPFWKLYKIGAAAKKDPKKASQEYQEVVRQDRVKFKELEQRGPNLEEGLQAYAQELFQAMSASFELELGILFFVVLPLFKELDKQRREGKTKEIRDEYDALCSGYEGDGLMKMNMDIYRLANLLPDKIWDEYSHGNLSKLADRVEENLKRQKQPDLPSEFLEAWNEFMDLHGWDGLDQLFPSSPRYRESPLLLLAKIKANIGVKVKNPADIQREHVEKRRAVVVLQEQRALEKRCYNPFALSKIQQRDASLEHLMMIRNDPKLHLSQLCGLLRAAVLKVEDQFLETGRLEQKGDIFHVDIDEVDLALKDNSYLMRLVRPRKVVYERALRAKECPILVDSRCRILKPDPPARGDHEDGILIGAAVSPGVATGRVRILHNPGEEFESGEVLAAVVTSPTWTPLFAGASAIILQVGGALQHGALCAREYGKPAVANIDIHSVLKTGMMVTVNGNTGTVKILDEQ